MDGIGQLFSFIGSLGDELSNILEVRQCVQSMGTSFSLRPFNGRSTGKTPSLCTSTNTNRHTPPVPRSAKLPCTALCARARLRVAFACSRTRISYTCEKISARAKNRKYSSLQHRQTEIQQHLVGALHCTRHVHRMYRYSGATRYNSKKINSFAPSSPLRYPKKKKRAKER